MAVSSVTRVVTTVGVLALVVPSMPAAEAQGVGWHANPDVVRATAERQPGFALFGDPPIAPDAMPALDQPLVRGRRGYHVRPGSHDLTPYDWARFADFADTLRE